MLPYLLTVISRAGGLTEADAALCEQYFEAVSLKKTTVVEAADAVPQHLYFIAEGYMRLYVDGNDGEQATTHLGAPGEFLTSFLSFIHERKAADNLVAVTDCQVLRITRPRLAALIAASEAFKNFSLLIFEQAIVNTQARANSLATHGAAQRYQQLLADRPEVLLHVPVRHVASFLGIKPESLSRIRRQAVS